MQQTTKSMLVAAAAVAIAMPAFAGSPPPPTYPTEAAAKQACPNDIVVWLNTRTGFYHYKGQKWYGTTTAGAYVCKAEADMAGDAPGDLPIPGMQ